MKFYDLMIKAQQMKKGCKEQLDYTIFQMALVEVALQLTNLKVKH
jgi:hypothetical protein